MPRRRHTPKEPSTDATAPLNTASTAPQTPGPSQGTPQTTATSSGAPRAATEPYTASTSGQPPVQASSAVPPTTAPGPGGKIPATDLGKEEEAEKAKDKRPTPPLYPLPSTTYRLVWYHNRTSDAAPSRCSPKSTITITRSPPPPSSPNSRPSYTATLHHGVLDLSFSVNYGLKQDYTSNARPYEDTTVAPTERTVLLNKGCTSISPASLQDALAKKPPMEQVWGTGGVMGLNGLVMQAGGTMRVPLTVAMSYEEDDRGEQFVEFWGWIDANKWLGELVWAVGKKVVEGEGEGEGRVGELSERERKRLGISVEDWDRSVSV